MLNKLFLNNITNRKQHETHIVEEFRAQQVLPIPKNTEFCIITPRSTGFFILGEKGNSEISIWEEGSSEKVSNAYGAIDGTYCCSSSIDQQVRIANFMGSYEYTTGLHPYTVESYISLKKNWNGKMSITKNGTTTYYTYVSAMSRKSITAKFNVPNDAQVYVRSEGEIGERVGSGNKEFQSTRFDISFKEIEDETYKFESDVSFSTDDEYLPNKVFKIQKGIYSINTPSIDTTPDDNPIGDDPINPNPNPKGDDDDGGLSKGAIIAIVVVVLVVVIAAVIAILWLKFCYCKKKHNEVQNAEV